MRRSKLYTSLFVVCTLGACGGSKQEAEEPQAETTVSREAEHPTEKASDEKQSDEKASDDKASGKSAEAKKKEAEPEQKAIRSAKDILQREGIFFELSFAASDAHQEAEKKCAEKSGDDPKKKADCMSKASQQMDGDGIAFRTDSEGKWWWYTIRRTGPKMVPLHKIQIEFADESDKSVAIVPKGRDQGSKPMGHIPDKVVVDVPSDSEITITDPKLGKLVYTAKMGLFGKDERGAP